MVGPGRAGAARARTVLVAHPGAELYGSDRVMLESVTGFVQEGWRVVVTVREDGPLVPELVRRGAQVVRTHSPVLRKSALRPTGLLRLLADVARGTTGGLRLLRSLRPAVLYVSTVTVPLWPVLARMLGTPVVVHVHEAEGSAPAAVRRVLALPLLLATRVVANSAFSVDVLRRSLPAAARRAEVVLNGVPGPRSAAPPRETIDGPLRILYVGRLSPRKGVDVVVEAVRQLTEAGQDVHLDVVGAVFTGYEWYETELRARIDAGELGDRVVLHGFHPTVWQFLEHADVAVVPSRVDEPFGNTAVEAVLAARPVVVSATSGLREAAAGYASAQYVTPGDSRDLARAIIAVRDDWTRFRESALADRAVAAERHSTQGYGQRLARILDDAARPGR